jgi:hypothetical protein
MHRPKVLVQLDTDTQPSLYDTLLATDAGAEHLFRHHGITPSNVVSLVQGVLAARGPTGLTRTALFVGGSDLLSAEEVLNEILNTFVETQRVSVLFDPSGSSSMAAATLLTAKEHLELQDSTALVLAPTTNVGQQVLLLLAREKVHVRVGGRSISSAKKVCDAILARVPGADLTPHAAATPQQAETALKGVQLVVAAGGAIGVRLLPGEDEPPGALKVAIDLNAIPPWGVTGVEVDDDGAERQGVLCYGAQGIRGMKMKLHKLALHLMFQQNDRVFDAPALYELGGGL